jgi:hypothetical protein
MVTPRLVLRRFQSPQDGRKELCESRRGDREEGKERKESDRQETWDDYQSLSLFPSMSIVPTDGRLDRHR